MRIALVSSSFPPAIGALGRHVEMLARGLAERGAEVEVLTQGQAQAVRCLPGYENVTIRSYASAVGPLRFAVAPRLWERLRMAADEFDVVDVHTGQPPLALAVARARVRRLVFTPRAPADRFLEWPYARAARVIVSTAARVVCGSAAERDVFCRAFPQAAKRMHVVPVGVDADAIRASTRFRVPETVVLAVSRLERVKCLDRAIAAMAGLDPEFRLVVVGDGPARNRLRAYAADLRTSSRVDFVGPVADPTLYRWLRTARVVLALAKQGGSGSQVREALAAGASVVASDIPVHREAAAESARDSIVFVSPESSPLEVADAITHAARLSRRRTPAPLPSWSSVVEDTWSVYRALVSGAVRPALPAAEAGIGGAGTVLRAGGRARGESTGEA